MLGVDFQAAPIQHDQTFNIHHSGYYLLNFLLNLNLKLREFLPKNSRTVDFSSKRVYLYLLDSAGKTLFASLLRILKLERCVVTDRISLFEFWFFFTFTYIAKHLSKVLHSLRKFNFQNLLPQNYNLKNIWRFLLNLIKETYILLFESWKIILLVNLVISPINPKIH